MSGRPKLTRREWVSTTIAGVLLLGAYVWGVWSMTDEEPTPPPDQGPTGEPWPELPAEDAGGY